MLADELMAILNELTQLGKMENSKVALRARQVTSKKSVLNIVFKVIWHRGHLKLDSSDILF